MKLTITDLFVSVENKGIIKGLNLTIKKGEVHAIMGPNGSGKSTLSLSLMGHPSYRITSGTVKIDAIDLLSLDVTRRARQGLFLAFQKPLAIPGVGVMNFLRSSYSEKNGKDKNKSIKEFIKLVKEKASLLHLKDDFLKRGLNEGFSGGESKKLEMLQMAILTPSFAILDEIDTGLDIDALKIVANTIETLRKQTGILIITHYQRILKYLKPDFVHMMIDGKIVKSGNYQLAKEIEESGYKSYETSKPDGKS